MADDGDFATAIALHRQGRLDEAAALYEALSDGGAGGADLLGLMGILDQQRGRLGSAAERLDRALVFGALGLLAGLGLGSGGWPGLVLAAMTLLLVVTIGNRCRRALAELRR